MAKFTPACMIGRLKDQRLQIPDRLKLACKLWVTEDEVGPNKHQVILDAVISILISNKKRHEMSREIERETWQTLSSLLHSTDVLQPCSKTTNPVTIRPAIAQVLLETLEQEGRQIAESGGLLSLALDCCHRILLSPALTCVLTVKLDVLVSLCSVICQVAVSLPVASNVSAIVTSVLSQLTTHLWQHHHRSQLAVSQVLQIVTEKLLQPVLLLTHMTQHSPDIKFKGEKDSNQLTQVASSLQDFVLATLFHENHQKLFRIYLDGVVKQQEVSQLPWTISNVFSKLSADLEKSKVDKDGRQEGALPRKVVLDFLPRLFLHAVTTWQQTKQLSFQLFIHLNTFLGVPVDQAQMDKQGGLVAMETNCVGTLCGLVALVREHGIYNVAADRAGDGSQLYYLRLLLSVLLETAVCDEVCGVLLELLQCNHLILELSLPAVLQHCCHYLHQASEEYRTRLDGFLTELVSTYSLLQQMPRFFSFLLQLNKLSPQQLISILPLQRFSHKTAAVLTTLTHNTAVDVRAKLQEEANRLVLSLTSDDFSETDEERLWGICLLLHLFLNAVRGSESDVSGRVGDRVRVLTSDLENKLLTPLLETKRTKVGRCVLLLAVCLGGIKLGVACPHDLPAPSCHHLPFSIQPSKKQAKGDAVVQYLTDVLTTQRLLVELRERSSVDCSLLLAGLSADTHIDSSNSQPLWDGNVCSVTENTYPVARWQVLLCEGSPLLPLLLQQQASQVADLLVHLFETPVPAKAPESKSVSCLAVGEELLQHWAVLDNKDFLHTLVCAVWQRFSSRQHFSSPYKGDNSTSKRKGKNCNVLASLQRLSNSHISWGNVKDSEVMSVARSIEQMLIADIVQPLVLSQAQAALLRMLMLIPLTDLPAGTRLQCMLGLLTIARHQQPWIVKDTGTMGSDQRDDAAQKMGEMLCKLLMLLMEASVGTSIFLCLPACSVLCALYSLFTQNQALEHSSLGTLLKTAVATVMGDFHSVLHLQDFITELEGQLKKVTALLTTKSLDLNKPRHRGLLTISHWLLGQTRRYLKKDIHRHDVQSACRRHFRVLSAAVEGVVDAYLQQSAGCLHPALLNCLTAITLQHCTDAATKGTQLGPRHLQRIQLVVQTLSVMNSQQAEALSQCEELAMVRCLYSQPQPLQALLTPDLTRTLWDTILQRLQHVSSEPHPGTEVRLQGDNATAKTERQVTCKRHRQDSWQDHSFSIQSKIPRLDIVSTSGEKCWADINISTGPGEVGGGDSAGGDNSIERGIEERRDQLLNTMAVVLASCHGSLFTHLIQQVLSLQVNRTADSVAVWQRVVQCDTLNQEQHTLVETLSTVVLQQCVQVMERVHSFPEMLAVNHGLPVLHCLTAMLNKPKLLSTKGTVLCLLCASLVPLPQASFPQFLCLLPAVCEMLHAVLVHHPHAALSALDQCLAITTSVLKECVQRGDQTLLLANPDFIKPMTQCSQHISRLVTLLVSHSTEMQRVVATLVSDYANAVRCVTLLPSVKKTLLSCMYACLDVCDKHAVNQLRARLPPGVREVFHMLHHDYTHYHKYTGKV